MIMQHVPSMQPDLHVLSMQPDLHVPSMQPHLHEYTCRLSCIAAQHYSALLAG